MLTSAFAWSSKWNTVSGLSEDLFKKRKGKPESSFYSLSVVITK